MQGHLDRAARPQRNTAHRDELLQRGSPGPRETPGHAALVSELQAGTGAAGASIARSCHSPDTLRRLVDLLSLRAGSKDRE